MNVMRQDAMNDKVKERCKTCEKQCMQEDLDWSRGIKMLSSQPRWIKKLSRSYRGDKNFLDGSRSCQKAIEIAIKRSWKISIDSLTVEKVSRL